MSDRIVFPFGSKLYFDNSSTSANVVRKTFLVFAAVDWSSWPWGIITESTAERSNDNVNVEFDLTFCESFVFAVALCSPPVTW